METRTRGKGTIDRGLRGSVGTLADANPTRLSKRSQGCPLTLDSSSGFFSLAIAVLLLLFLCKSQLARGLGMIPYINEGIGSGLTLLSGLIVLLLGQSSYKWVIVIIKHNWGWLLSQVSCSLFEYDIL